MGIHWPTKTRRWTMLKTSKILLIVAGILLVLDAILIVAGIPNPLFGWPLPCPMTYVILGVGLIFFGFGSGAFKKA
jgi:hypothetical protein